MGRMCSAGYAWRIGTVRRSGKRHGNRLPVAPGRTPAETSSEPFPEFRGSIIRVTIVLPRKEPHHESISWPDAGRGPGAGTGDLGFQPGGRSGPSPEASIFGFRPGRFWSPVAQRAKRQTRPEQGTDGAGGEDR